MVICFATCAILGFFMVLNYHALLDYKKYSQKALRVFTETRKSRKTLRILCIIGAVVCLGVFITALIFRFMDAANAMAFMALAFLLALHGFVPFSSALWTLDANGVYIYRARRFIPWTQIIQHGSIKKRKTTLLTFRLKQETGEMFKRIYYSVILPEEQLEETQQIIREFLHAIETQKYYKRRQEEKKQDLKDRKWY